ncbi:MULTISPECIES: hypothetical protein [Chitinibacter]|uniref:hypothetical protein n=1 Tax=Chitinibacter TaxID=230666 RepID=UPI000646BECD|nr:MULTISPECIES: hypothetical protein [Chitinibacter]
MFNPEFSLPVALPMRFFRMAPLWLAITALAGFGLDGSDWHNRYNPALLAMTHLLMLGFAGNIMLGALLQVSAVVAGVRAKQSLRWGMALWGGLQLGTALLAVGLWTMQPLLLQGAAGVLGLSLFPLTIWLLSALFRSRARDATSRGLRYATLALALTVTAGIALVLLLTMGWMPIPLPDLLRAHVLLGIIGWVSGLLLAVALTVVPMFLVTQSWPDWLGRWLLPALLVLTFLAALDARSLIILPLPLLIWVVALLRQLRTSQRKADPARYLWAWGGLNLLLPLLIVPWLDALPESIPVGLAGHWLLAGLLPVFTAMLAKIIPFLLWMDYRLRVPTGGKLRHMGQIFPERWLRRLSWLALSMGISWWLFYLLAYIMIPVVLLVYALALGYCLQRSVVAAGSVALTS